jgi:hypothetical protein
MPFSMFSIQVTCLLFMGNAVKSQSDKHLERAWTARLIAFYRQAHSNDFSQTVAAVKDFARLDALKGRLRDEMRAKALQAAVER